MNGSMDEWIHACVRAGMRACMYECKYVCTVMSRFSAHFAYQGFWLDCIYVTFSQCFSECQTPYAHVK